MVGVETKPKEFVLTEELFAEIVRNNLSLTAQILSRSLEKKDLSLADRMFTEIMRKLYHWPKWKIKWRDGPN